jgi:hypothetical protein
METMLSNIPLFILYNDPHLGRFTAQKELHRHILYQHHSFISSLFYISKYYTRNITDRRQDVQEVLRQDEVLGALGARVPL